MALHLHEGCVCLEGGLYKDSNPLAAGLSKDCFVMAKASWPEENTSLECLPSSS